MSLRDHVHAGALVGVGDPSRVAIEVCKPGTSCDESKDDDWLEFDTCWNSLTLSKKLNGPIPMRARPTDSTASEALPK